MITGAPLPTWKSLGKTLFPQDVDHASILSCYTREDEMGFLTSRSSASLAIISQAVSELRQKKNVQIWVPSYFCDQSLVALRRTSCEMSFYPVTADLLPDESFFETQMVKPDILVVTHYMGHKTNIKFAKKFARTHDCFLVEDAVHLPFPSKGVGESADFTLYSPHKWLAIPEIAVLVVNTKAKQIKVFEPKLIKKTISRLIQMGPRSSSRSTLVWDTKRVIQKLGLHQAKAPASPLKPGEHPLPNYKPNHRAIACLAQTLKTQDVQMMKRQRVAEGIKDMLQWSGARVESLPDIPYLVPFHASGVSDPLNRSPLVHSWPDLPHEVVEGGASYLNAQELTAERRFHICHQTIDRDDLLRLFPNFKKQVQEKIDKNYCLKWVNQEDWLGFYRNIGRTNLSQNLAYNGLRVGRKRFINLKQGVIYNGPKAVAIFSIYLVNAAGIKLINMNRGPLFISSRPSTDEMINVYAALKRELGTGLLLIRPELEDSEINHLILASLGYHQRERPDLYKSSWIDLRQPKDKLRSLLKSKWRNKLKFAERAELTVTTAVDEGSFEKLKELNQAQQASKGYASFQIPSLEHFSPDKALGGRIFVASAGGEWVAAVLFVSHGLGATYMVGWSNEEGRKRSAMNLLLWESIIRLKDDGIQHLDTGGIDEVGTPSIAFFKQGLSGEEYTLVGRYSAWL